MKKEVLDARYTYMETEVGYDFIVDIVDTKWYSDYIVSMGGDVVTFRVAGSNTDDFIITER